MAVVKSNAYGHGLELIVQASAGLVDYWGVNSYQEAKKVRKVEKKTPILILGGNGQFDLPAAEEIYSQKIEFTLTSLDAIKGWIQRGYASVPIHIKIDTGMGRLGINYQEWQEFCHSLQSLLVASKLPIKVLGLMTHFSNIEDEPAGVISGHAKNQQDRFHACVQIFHRHCLPYRSLENTANSFSQSKDGNTADLILHSCATAGALVFPKAHQSMIRIGVGLYGLPMPSELQRQTKTIQANADRKLEPVLFQWLGKVVHRTKVAKGQSIGYENSHIVSEDSDIAIIGVGYNEGYARVLSNQAQVCLPSNERASVIGKVSMNMTAINLKNTNGKLRVGEFVVLLGMGWNLGRQHQRKGAVKKRIDCQVLADQMKKIPRELMTGLSAEISREFIC